MVRLASAASGILLLLFAAGELRAQADAFWEPGFWINGGLGASASNVDCVRCAQGTRLGYAGFVALGGSLSERVRLGVEIFGSRRTMPDTTREFIAAWAIAQVQPMQNLPLYLEGGLGGGRFAEEQGINLLSAEGLGIVIGAGGYLRLSRRWSLIPYLHYTRTPKLAWDVNDLPQLTDLQANVVYFGVGVGWR